MNSYEADKQDEQLYTMTGIPLEKREEYMQWLGRQNESIIVMIFQKTRKQYYQYRKKYLGRYDTEVMNLAALIETIALCVELDNSIDTPDADSFFLEKTHIENFRESHQCHR